MIDVQKLIAAVANETTVDNSILALLDQVVVSNKAISQQLADAIAANDPVALAAVQKAIDDSTATIVANTAKIQLAVTTNTPPATDLPLPPLPPPVPAPPAQ